MQQAKYPRFESTMWGDIPITAVEHQSLILQPIAPDTNNTIVLEVENLAGTTTLSVDGDGDLICKTITSGATSNTRSGTNNNLLGGSSNTLSSSNSFIGGGQTNFISSSTNSAVLNGENNSINSTSSTDTVIVCGKNNLVSATTSSYGGIFCGQGNSIIGANSEGSTILGGYVNIVNDSQYSHIGSGNNNILFGSSVSSAIVGGSENAIEGATGSYIGGGLQNVIYLADKSTIAGGEANVTTQIYTCIPGGFAAVANNWGQKSWAGGNFFTTAGDSQVSEYTLRNGRFGGAGGATTLYLDFPNGPTQEITIGPLEFGIADISMITIGLTTVRATYYRNSYYYSSSPGTITSFVVTPVVFSIGASTMIVPTVSIVASTTLRIVAQINTAENVHIFAHVRLAQIFR